MTRASETSPRLGELETEVLEYLWSVGEADVLQVHAAIGKRRQITPNTVGSAIERLFRKRLVRRQKVSHAYRYAPTLDRDAFALRRVAEAAGGLQAMAKAGLLSAFVDLVADVDDAALDRLEALIAKKRGGQAG